MHFHYRVTFTGYIWCFCATTSRNIVTLTFNLDLDNVSYTVPLTLDPHNNLIILRLSGTELWITEFDHISVIGNSHCACAVSRDLSSGGKMVHIFGIPDPNLPIHFVTFRVLRRRLSHVVGENSIVVFFNLFLLEWNLSGHLDLWNPMQWHNCFFSIPNGQKQHIPAHRYVQTPTDSGVDLCCLNQK